MTAPQGFALLEWGRGGGAHWLVVGPDVLGHL